MQERKMIVSRRLDEFSYIQFSFTFFKKEKKNYIN